MNGRQHLAVGIISAGVGAYGLSLAGAPVFEESNLVIGLLIAGVGALAPDIDHPKAYISHRIPHQIIRRVLPFFLFALAIAFFPLFLGEIPAEIGRLNRLLLQVTLLVLGFGLGLKALSSAIANYTRHRGATHSIFFMFGVSGWVLIFCLYLGYSFWYAIYFAWGWFSHLIADATTDMGLPDLFWPFTPKIFKKSQRQIRRINRLRPFRQSVRRR